MLYYSKLYMMERRFFPPRFTKMIHQNSEISTMKCVCPECKNTLDLTRYPNLTTGMVIECNHCGMTLLVKGIAGGDVKAEIVDEGK